MEPLTVCLLSPGQVESYARHYKRDENLFAEEENKCKSQQQQALREIDEIQNEIKNLGVKNDPGDQPDFEPFVKPICSTVGWIWGVCVVLVFLLHCCIWVLNLLFNIPWNTWEWTKVCFMYGLYAELACFVGGAGIYGIAYWIWNSRKKAFLEWMEQLTSLKADLRSKKKDVEILNSSISNINTNRQNILACAFRLILSLPIRSIATSDFDKMRKTFFKTLDDFKNFQAISDPTDRIEAMFSYYDTKLALFHEVSIPSEAISAESLQTVKNAITKAESFRSVWNLSETNESYVTKLTSDNSIYNANSLDANIDEFKALLEMDTSGFLTKHDSGALEKQVAGLNKIFGSTVAFYDQYNNLINKINHALGVVRLVAYRNIYLGAELLNIVHEGAGGGKLTTAFDSIEGSVDLSKSKVKIETFTTSDAISSMIASGLDSITTSVSNVLNDKKATKYALNNPKAAAIAVAGQAAFAIIDSGIKAWKKRNAKIEGLLKQEEKLIENQKKVVDSYLMNFSSSERALELIKAIIKVNDGFLSIYTPIYKKVFIDRSFVSVSMTELQQLALAISEYKKISDSKL